MVKEINIWTQKIVIVVIICTIIEMILPESKNKKYIKTVMGIYIVFTIISPIVQKIHGNNIDLNKYINLNNLNNTVIATNAPIDTNKYVEEVYIEKLKKDIEEKIKALNYTVKKIELKIETKDEAKYGEIIELKIKIEKINQENINHIQINKVKIGEIEEEKITKEEIQNIKEYLCNTYNLDQERIEVE